MTRIPRQPLMRIGLSCSGGGYRAASFHLGAMSYLNRLQYNGCPLLENVKLISTVSGGTITGIIYALQKQRGAAFSDIYRFTMDKLYTLDLVKAGIEKLNPDGVWQNTYKHKNLINAFAELYDKEFTEGKTFREFHTLNSHLEAVVFNSTEFKNGINFRFRNWGTGFFGNYKFQVPEVLADEVKLSDAMASSSCFTGGFEPMIWPHDFVHDEAPNLKKIAETATPLGIMDGGIYDNQGIESILNYKSNSKEPYFDLIIISDVASPYMDGYQPTKDRPKEGFRKLTLKDIKTRASRISSSVNIALVILILVSLLLPVFTGFRNNWITGFGIGLAIAFLLFFIAKLVAQNYLKSLTGKLLQGFKRKVPPFYADKLSRLKIEELSVHRLEPLVLDRLNSLITLLMDVFLKVVRRLNYYKLYNNDQYRYRRITNLIKELTEEDYFNRGQRENDGRPVSERYQVNTVLKGSYHDIIGTNIKTIIEEASSFGTTLWFTKDEQLGNMLNKLVASGQFTMCYNMLEYLEILIYDEDSGFDALDDPTKTAVRSLYEQCKGDWFRFKQEPMFMV